MKKITGCRTEIGGFWPLVQGGYTSTLTTVYGTKLTPVEEEISFLVILWTSDVNIIIIFNTRGVLFLPTVFFVTQLAFGRFFF